MHLPFEQPCSGGHAVAFPLQSITASLSSEQRGHVLPSSSSPPPLWPLRSPGPHAANNAHASTNVFLMVPSGRAHYTARAIADSENKTPFSTRNSAVRVVAHCAQATTQHVHDFARYTA